MGKRYSLEVELFGIGKWIGCGEKGREIDARMSPRFLAQACTWASHQILDHIGQ